MENTYSGGHRDAIPKWFRHVHKELDYPCRALRQPMTRDINCLEGTLWLTFDGVRKDIILEAGQSYRCDCASRLAIQALDAARFDMT